VHPDEKISVVVSPGGAKYKRIDYARITHPAIGRMIPFAPNSEKENTADFILISMKPGFLGGLTGLFSLPVE